MPAVRKEGPGLFGKDWLHALEDFLLLGSATTTTTPAPRQQQPGKKIRAGRSGATTSGDDDDDDDVDVTAAALARWLSLPFGEEPSADGFLRHGDRVRLRAGKQLLQLDTAGLLPGVYGTDLEIAANDPVNPADTIAVSLTVLGAPEVSLSPDSLFAYTAHPRNAHFIRRAVH